MLGFCFLIYDEINHEDLWIKFFEKADPGKYRIYIHYKNNKSSRYFDRYKLNDCVVTKYAEISLVFAQNVMLKHALADGCSKMIFLSQACIPFKSFNYVYEFLMKDDKCHFNMEPHEVCFPRCDPLMKYYPRETIQKASQWCILNRTVAEVVISKRPEEMAAEFSVYAPDEHYYITMVYHHKLTDQINVTMYQAEGATTFTNWHGMTYKYSSSFSLKNYYYISSEELVHLLRSPCLFGRKFGKECAPYLHTSEYLAAIS